MGTLGITAPILVAAGGIAARMRVKARICLARIGAWGLKKVESAKINSS
jgi:hypothetical protein